jgi:hypothetical protein
MKFSLKAENSFVNSAKVKKGNLHFNHGKFIKMATLVADKVLGNDRFGQKMTKVRRLKAGRRWDCFVAFLPKWTKKIRALARI